MENNNKTAGFAKGLYPKQKFPTNKLIKLKEIMLI